jgi:hypothetical protein
MLARSVAVPLREKEGRLKLPINGEEIAVSVATHLSCPKCHEVVLRFDDARRLRQRADDRPTKPVRLEVKRGPKGWKFRPGPALVGVSG